MSKARIIQRQDTLDIVTDWISKIRAWKVFVWIGYSKYTHYWKLIDQWPHQTSVSTTGWHHWRGGGEKYSVSKGYWIPVRLYHPGGMEVYKINLDSNVPSSVLMIPPQFGNIIHQWRAVHGWVGRGEGSIQASGRIGVLKCTYKGGITEGGKVTNKGYTRERWRLGGKAIGGWDYKLMVFSYFKHNSNKMFQKTTTMVFPARGVIVKGNGYDLTYQM